MIYTAGWEAGGKFMGEGDGGNKMPEPNHWYLNNTYSKSKTTNRRRRGEESREERRKGGEGRKEGTQIINATGLRPFRIFKRNKLLLSTRTFHFPFSFFIIVSTYLEKKKKVTQHLKWSINSQEILCHSSSHRQCHTDDDPGQCAHGRFAISCFSVTQTFSFMSIISSHYIRAHQGPHLSLCLC